MRSRQNELDREIVTSAGNQEKVRSSPSSARLPACARTPSAVVISTKRLLYFNTAIHDGWCCVYFWYSLPVFMVHLPSPQDVLGGADVSIADSMRFKGAAPEIINGR